MPVTFGVFARPVHSTSEFAMTVLSKCVCARPCACACVCVCLVLDSVVTFFKYAGGRGGLQNSAQRSSLQARIDHPCVPAPDQSELLISVPIHCFTVLPLTQFRFLLI